MLGLGTPVIHGAAIYGVPWIPSIYPSDVSINIPAPWIRHGIWLEKLGGINWWGWSMESMGHLAAPTVDPDLRIFWILDRHFSVHSNAAYFWYLQPVNHQWLNCEPHELSNFVQTSKPQSNFVARSQRLTWPKKCCFCSWVENDSIINQPSTFRFSTHTVCARAKKHAKADVTKFPFTKLSSSWQLSQSPKGCRTEEISVRKIGDGWFTNFYLFWNYYNHS